MLKESRERGENAKMKTYHDLKDMLCRELDEITKKGELTAGSLDTVDKLTHSIKSIETIIAMNEAQDGESGYYPYIGEYRSYEDGMVDNYRRGRSGARRRDSMGRYSREKRGGYSRDDAREDMIEDLRELMNEAKDESTKKQYHKFIRELENA